MAFRARSHQRQMLSMRADACWLRLVRALYNEGCRLVNRVVAAKRNNGALVMMQVVDQKLAGTRQITFFRQALLLRSNPALIATRKTPRNGGSC